MKSTCTNAKERDMVHKPKSNEYWYSSRGVDACYVGHRVPIEHLEGPHVSAAGYYLCERRN